MKDAVRRIVRPYMRTGDLRAVLTVSNGAIVKLRDSAAVAWLGIGVIEGVVDCPSWQLVTAHYPVGYRRKHQPGPNQRGKKK